MESPVKVAIPVARKRLEYVTTFPQCYTVVLPCATLFVLSSADVNRREQCDQKPDGCSQCERAKRKCPGYRALRLNIRNESENVIRKAKATEAKASRIKERRKEAAPITATSLRLQSLVKVSGSGTEEYTETARQSRFPVSSSRSASPSDDANFQFATSISRHVLEIPLEDRATLFFASNYIIGGNGPNRGHLDYLANLYNTNSVDEGLQASMKAVGFAGFSHIANTPQLMVNARHQYIRALKLTNAALASPMKAKEDTTLISVMVLGIFETITGCNQRSFKAWAGHVEGACALLKLRGPEQFQGAGGRLMFLQVVTSLVYSSIQCGKPLPRFIIEWTREARKALLSYPDPSQLLQEAMMDFTDFQASLCDRSCSDPKIILARACKY